jgi:hypothetical protein
MPTELTTAIVEHLADLINLRLAAASAKTKASLALIADGRRAEAFDILLDIEPPLHEARALLNTIATLQRDAHPPRGSK